MDTTKKTIILFSGDFDKVMAALIIANGAAAMGDDVTIFATFWGLNILRKPEKVSGDGKSTLQTMFGGMMPKGTKKLGLSKMNMAGMGAPMMSKVTKAAGGMSLEELFDSAREQGVKFVACTLSMDILGFKEEELIDGIEFAGVAAYLGRRRRGQRQPVHLGGGRWRTQINPGLADELQAYGATDADKCFNCGTCSAVCVHSEEPHVLPRRPIHALQLGLEDKLKGSLEPWMCYYCGECSEQCPKEAEPGETMMGMRRWLTAKYDFSGLSGLFYRSPAWEIIAIVIAAILTGIGFVAFGILQRRQLQRLRRRERLPARALRPPLRLGAWRSSW